MDEFATDLFAGREDSAETRATEPAMAQDGELSDIDAPPSGERGGLRGRGRMAAMRERASISIQDRLLEKSVASSRRFTISEPSLVTDSRRS